MLSLVGFFMSCFVPNANLVIKQDLTAFTDILVKYDIPFHSISARVKTFDSARIKLSKSDLFGNNIFKLYDLIGFRMVFYTSNDLYQFSRLAKQEKFMTYVHDYIKDPKDNGYKAYHFHYRNTVSDCPIENIECQLVVLDNFYNNMHGTASNHKDYANDNIPFDLKTHEDDITTEPPPLWDNM